jgi:tetratricopeptide (TPR) repeat protein
MKLRDVFVLAIIIILFVMPALEWDWGRIQESIPKQPQLRDLLGNDPLHSKFQMSTTSNVNGSSKSFSIAQMIRVTKKVELQNASFMSITPIEKNISVDIPYVFFQNGSGKAGHISKNETYGNSILSLKKEFNVKVEPLNTAVRGLAVNLASEYPGNYRIEQVCAIFANLKRGWIYWPDVRGGYVNYANESIKECETVGCVGVGNCNDFAILMAGLVEAIGGTSRIIWAYPNKGTGHAYAEVYIGQLEPISNGQNKRVEDIIYWLMENNSVNKIFAHIDANTKEVWLNLDWSSNNPGGILFEGDKEYYVFNIGDNLPKSTPEITNQYLKPDGTLVIYANVPMNYSHIWQNMGLDLINRSELDSAIICFNNAIDIDPKSAEAWKNKGNTLYRQRKVDEAMLAYDKAIDLDPTIADTLPGKYVGYF